MIRSRYEIDIVEEARRQQVMRQQGFKFCPKCGRAHQMPKGLKGIKLTGTNTIVCGCGGEIKF